MLAISDAKLDAFSRRFIGTVRPVLAEHSRRGKPLAGFTDNYLRVEIPSAPQIDNKIVNVSLKSISPDGEKIIGELAS